MNRRKALSGFSLLCTIAFSAFAAQSAFAATSGTTAFKCESVAEGTGSYSDAHCVTPSGSNRYTHKVLTAATAVTGTNASTKNETKEATNAVLEGIAGGVIIEIVATSITTTGTLTNSLEGERHRLKGSNMTLILTGPTVPKPAGQECKVAGGEIKTNSLKSEDVGMTIVTSPTVGTELASITLEGCKTAGLNKAYALTGVLEATPSGGTTIYAIVRNALSQIFFGGIQGGFQMSETVKSGTSSISTTTTTPFTE